MAKRWAWDLSSANQALPEICIFSEVTQGEEIILITGP